MPSEENNVGTISMHEFLDFLKITCQVNESIDGRKSSNQIDYNQLAKNELVNSLFATTKPHQIKNVEQITDIDAEYDPKESDRNLVRDKSREKIAINNKRRLITTSKTNKSKSDLPCDYRGQLHPVLSEKLNEAINEGILDSVLPFVCPINSSTSINYQQKLRPTNPTPRVQAQQIFDFKPPQSNNNNDSSSDLSASKRSPRPNDTISITNNLSIPGSRDRMRRKSMSPMSASGERNEVDVVIHVCDEVKGVSRDFMCPQKLLVSKMGYFADVTTGSSKLYVFVFILYG